MGWGIGDRIPYCAVYDERAFCKRLGAAIKVRGLFETPPGLHEWDPVWTLVPWRQFVHYKLVDREFKS